MREKEDFRGNLERLNELYPNRELLSISETAKVLGITRQKMSHDWNNEFVRIGN
jgi:hypothetical protein